MLRADQAVRLQTQTVIKLKQGKWGDPAMSTSKDPLEVFILGIPRGCCKSK